MGLSQAEGTARAGPAGSEGPAGAVLCHSEMTIGEGGGFRQQASCICHKTNSRASIQAAALVWAAACRGKREDLTARQCAGGAEVKLVPEAAASRPLVGRGLD